MQKALFLDRDGVINHDPGDYTKSVNEFTINPNVFSFLKQAQDLGYLLIVITNQGGIGRRLYTKRDVDEIHDFLRSEAKKYGVEFSGIYYCVHHPITSACLCRKPGSLLIEKALYAHNINAASSFMIGDKDRDIECAEHAGVKGIKVEVNHDLMATDIIQQIQ